MIIRLIDLLTEDRKDSSTTKQAKSIGLVSMGFGRWGKDGTVTHTTRNGTLTPVKSKTDTSTTQPITTKQSTPQSSAQQPTTTSKAQPIPFDEFERGISKFTEEDEAIADRDEESGSAAIFGSDNYEEVVATIEKWKWGGDEGKGAWGFEASERQEIFDTVNRTIRETNARVEAPRLHRGVAFGSSEGAQRFIEQFQPGQSVEMPPCGWSPNSEVSMGYGPNDPSRPEVSAMIELEAGDSPIRGLATTSIERNMGMEVQHEVITPGDVKYEVREVTQQTVTRDGRTQTIYRVVLRQSGYANENVNADVNKYSILAYMGGNMGMARNIRNNYKKIRKNK